MNLDYNILDVERLIGVTGYGGAADILEWLEESNIDEEDYWIVQKTAEIGFETGYNSASNSD